MLSLRHFPGLKTDRGGQAFVASHMACFVSIQAEKIPLMALQDILLRSQCVFLSTTGVECSLDFRSTLPHRSFALPWQRSSGLFLFIGIRWGRLACWLNLSVTLGAFPAFNNVFRVECSVGLLVVVVVGSWLSLWWREEQREPLFLA